MNAAFLGVTEILACHTQQSFQGSFHAPPFCGDHCKISSHNQRSRSFRGR